jgi:Bacterial PH domain/Protein of unknown function (DUF2510)
MTSYIEQNLQPGETIDYRGYVSWVFALHRAAITFACSIPLFATEAKPFAALLLIFAIALAISGWIRVETSEYAVTDRRVIGKYGWLGSQSVDVLLTKVTGVVVANTVLGRVFGYGTVVVDAAGVSRGLVAMQNPQAFVSAVYKRLDSSPTAASVRPAPQQPSSPPNGLPPGWYPDQNDPSLLRYFDGHQWTSRTARMGN